MNDKDPMQSPGIGLSGDHALCATVIDRLYAAVLDPSALPELIDQWEMLVPPTWRQGNAARRKALEDSGFAGHVTRAEQMLARLHGGATPRPEEAALDTYRRAVAFTLDRGLRVTAVTRGTRDTLGITRGSALAAINLRPEHANGIASAAATLFRQDGPARPRMLRARRKGDDRIVLLNLNRVTSADHPPFIVVATTELHFPPGAAASVRAAFGLTDAETEVLFALWRGRAVAEIAAARDRSVDTVRTQVKSLLAKTETNSQTDLLRVAMTAMSIAGTLSAPAPQDKPPSRVLRGGLELPDLAVHRLVRPAGRVMEYIEFGDPHGRPVIYFCGNFGLCRWPATAEFAAAQTGLRIIVPIRPGYGGSDPLAPDTDQADAVARDILALMDRLGIAQAHALVIGEDLPYVARMFALAPGRIAGVLGCGASLPYGGAAHYERMAGWQRFVLGNARYTPQFLPFAVRAGFAMARHLGKAEFIRMAYAASPADEAMTRNPRILDAVDCGSDIVLGDRVDATRAFAADVTVFHRTDWTGALRDMARVIPVVDLIGSEDGSLNAATLAEVAQTLPEVVIDILPEAGSFVLFQQWVTVLQQLDAMMAATRGDHGKV